MSFVLTLNSSQHMALRQERREGKERLTALTRDHIGGQKDRSFDHLVCDRDLMIFKNDVTVISLKEVSNTLNYNLGHWNGRLTTYHVHFLAN